MSCGDCEIQADYRGQLREQLPKVRAQYERYKGTGLKREHDALVDLQRLVKRLWEEFPALIQQLNEYGDKSLTETTGKLYDVLKKYVISAPKATQLSATL